MEVKEFKAKTVDEAITAATLELGISSDKLQYEVVDEGSKGFLGIFNSKPAVIKVILKKSLLERTQEFCDELFAAMKVETTVNIDFREEDNVMNIDLSGSDMGILIGKRGQTLDALQYLISLYVNRESDAYIRVKLDTENYRERRKATLEKLAKKILENENIVTEKKIKQKDIYIVDVEERLTNIFGTKVNISKGKKKGKIEIEYYNDEDLDSIVSLLLEGQEA